TSKSGNECRERRNSGNDIDIRPSYDTDPMAENDSNVTSDSSDMSHNVSKVDQHAAKPEDKRVLLVSLIANLKLDVDENKKTQNQLKKANKSLT
ncbi:hypothetical protein Tco_1497647, partial [Tanacetum coccineum]